MIARIREITDSLGARLRVSVEAHPMGALILLEQSRPRGKLRAMLDGYGVEVLAGYIMAARLALPNDLPDELLQGQYPSRLRLVHSPHTAVILTQAELERPFEIPATFWDRLYAELCLVTAHARQLDRKVVSKVG